MSVNDSVACRSFAVASILLLVGVAGAAIPKITSQPADLTVHVGDSAVFVVDGSGYDSLRWFRDGARIPGATGAKMLLASTVLADNGATFSCVLYNNDGGRRSRDASLSVLRPTRELVTVTGELSDRNGQLLGRDYTVNQDFVVEVFGQKDGGDTLYSEAFLGADGKAVEVSNGRFVMRLGAGRVLKGNLVALAREKQTLYLQFSLGVPGSRESLEPRLPITAMPYALSGDASVLKGNGSPITIGLTAPVGSWYVDNTTGKTWFRTFRTWVLSE